MTLAAAESGADAARVPAAGPGAMLRVAREGRGLSVAAVSEALHVDTRVIESLEADRYAVFDAPVYARGFLRKYASYLELPAGEVVAAYEVIEGGPTAPSHIPLTSAAHPPRDLTKLRLLAVCVAALALVAASFWWWSTRAPHAGSPAAQSTAPAPTPAAALPPPAAAAEPTAAERAAEAADEPPMAPSVPAPAPAAVQRPAPAATRPAAARLATGAVAAAGSLVVTGVRDCWVEVYAPGGARLLYDLVRTGEHRALPGPGPWRVFLGYADGVRLQVGEHPVSVPAQRRSGPTARFVIATDGATT
jgi:cytoskeleton protein RodZ